MFLYISAKEHLRGDTVFHHHIQSTTKKKAFLKEVAVSSQRELLDEQEQVEEKREVKFERISDSAEPEGKKAFSKLRCRVRGRLDKSISE